MRCCLTDRSGSMDPIEEVFKFESDLLREVHEPQVSPRGVARPVETFDTVCRLQPFSK